MKIIYPGSFDPLTKGHIDIINRILKMFKNFKIYIIVANNRDKTHMFSVEERKKMIKSTFKNEKLNIIEFDGIISNYINKNNIDIIIRGIRNYTDFEYEKNIELFTKKQQVLKQFI